MRLDPDSVDKLRGEPVNGARFSRSLNDFRDETHHVHDYGRLVQRWKKIARRGGLKLEAFAQAGDFTLYYLQTRPAAEGKRGGVYVSAGIHGDEPAATEGLAQWAERHLPAVARAGQLPMLLFPCLNPFGLLNNQRTDGHGTDLNRVFGEEDLTPIREWKALLAGRRFDLALTLHEDFDAQGVYLYELRRLHRSWGAELLGAVADLLPAEPRHTVDGRQFRRGVLSTRYNVGKVPGYPEAILLYKAHARRVYTVETPSEFSLRRRVLTQVRLIETCLALLSPGHEAHVAHANGADERERAFRALSFDI